MSIRYEAVRLIVCKYPAFRHAPRNVTIAPITSTRVMSVNTCPGVKPLLANQKIAALQNDPEIARDIMKRDYLGLLRNSHILAAANDCEIGELMRKFEFEKALDYAIRKPEKEAAKARE